MNRNVATTSTLDSTMSPFDDLVKSMGAAIVDPDGPAAKMGELTSLLSQTTLNPNSRDSQVDYYYKLNLAEIPSTFQPLSSSQRSSPRVQAVLEKYSSWFEAADTDVCDEIVPSDAWTLCVLSKAMVEIIVTRARDGDTRMPPCSPQGHPCCPFWSRPNDDSHEKNAGKEKTYGGDVLAGLMK